MQLFKHRSHSYIGTQSGQLQAVGPFVELYVNHCVELTARLRGG